MKKSVIFLFVIVLFFCNGCSNSIVEFKKSVLGVNFDGNVKLVKENITVTKADYMNDNSYSKKYQNYEICIPYKVHAWLVAIRNKSVLPDHKRKEGVA